MWRLWTHAHLEHFSCPCLEGLFLTAQFVTFADLKDLLATKFGDDHVD